MSSGKHRNYDRRILMTFDIIGSYFIDVFYNDLFLKAKDALKNGRAKSLTDAYRNNVITYMKGVAENAQVYVGLTTKLHQYYHTMAKHNTTTLSDFEDRILSQFIPPEYYGDFTNKNKETALREIIVKAVNQLAEIVLEPRMLGKIIDDHLNETNVSWLQETVIDIFISQREEYFTRFVNEISKTNGNATVSRDMFKKLKSAYVDETKKRISAETDRDRAISLLRGSMEKITEQSNTISKLEEQLEYLRGSTNHCTNHDIGLTSDALYDEVDEVVTETKKGSSIISDLQMNSERLDKKMAKRDDAGLKLSELTKPPRSKMSQKVETKTAIRRKKVPEPETSESEDSEDQKNSENSEKSENSDDSEKSENSENSSEDSADVHNRQRKAIAERFNIESIDDPGFG